VCFSGIKEQVAESGVHTSELAKRLIDYGYHPPTIYFLYCSRSDYDRTDETESKETLDNFCEAMIAIALEAKEIPMRENAPLTTPVSRLDEVLAAQARCLLDEILGICHCEESRCSDDAQSFYMR